MSDFEDLNLVCRDCGGPFVLTAKDQAFFARMSDENGKPFVNPVRCKPCRDLKKAQRMGASPVNPAPQALPEDEFHPKKRSSGGRRRERDDEY